MNKLNHLIDAILIYQYYKKKLLPKKKLFWEEIRSLLQQGVDIEIAHNKKLIA